MAWRVHITDESIYRLEVIPGTPTILCAWVTGRDAAFYNLATGALLGRLAVAPPIQGIAERGTDEWRLFLDTLVAPNGGVLPEVRLQNLTIHSTDDGRQRLYDDGHGLTVQIDGAEVPLGSTDTQFVAVAMDRVMGVTAALDELGRMYIFQQNIPIGSFDIGLKPENYTIPDLVVADNAAAIFASDGRQIVRVTTGGEVDKARPTTHFVNKIACSRDGTRCAINDPEAGIVRVFEGEDMAFTHQKFAIDLYAAAEPVQLLEDVPTPRLAVSAMTITDDGVVAFAMEGIVTVTNLDEMEKMPRPQSLL